ncbi:ferritin-like domain-containing protein [Methylobacter sp.]|uniref:ferritin-like domain-containing protein n=1 Tax=Methylobacter sp. TaxID=2051955 RepID=UPI001225F89B|nr:ferritin-like domain-containing protein [Methylobacter sp.]TAK61135.1 MAG: ferritin-like domain-containing protein [Methylobacter sp.]
MNNVFEFAEAFFRQANVDEKLALTHQAWQAYIAGELTFISDRPVLQIDQVTFPEKPELLAPRQMPRRKLTTADGVAAFFHAIAHVEFVAIYLAWDILYRFRGMPKEFYQDWLRVADEEAQHFVLIRTHLRAMQIDYGDLPAHSGLWDHAKDTADDLPGRLAMVPRCMEARGLDVTPALIEKFRILGDDASVAILTRILTDEVGHVELGSKWFKFVCRQRGFEAEATYRELIDQYYVGGKPKGPFNRELRKIAGFSDAEIDWLEC